MDYARIIFPVGDYAANCPLLTRRVQARGGPGSLTWIKAGLR